MHKTMFQRSKDVLFTQVGDDVIALNVERGLCFGMEEVARAVWNLLEEPTDVGSLCDRLIDCYDVDPERCRAEVGALIDELVAGDLVQAV